MSHDSSGVGGGSSGVGLQPAMLQHVYSSIEEDVSHVDSGGDGGGSGNGGGGGGSGGGDGGGDDDDGLPPIT